ncbi:hypothetical protein [Helicobacter marmotae]|uniref:hypothetical protein n=1 Tax=Helicobacter marmotae TaxID=152490 RepID=UPI001F1C99F2|nr:hypothetical protein [Helicobacter marmotae]
MSSLNLWILTEERPKLEVLHFIVKMFMRDARICAFMDNVRILPIVKQGMFNLLMKLSALEATKLQKYILKSSVGKVALWIT